MSSSHKKEKSRIKRLLSLNPFTQEYFISTTPNPDHMPRALNSCRKTGSAYCRTFVIVRTELDFYDIGITVHKFLNQLLQLVVVFSFSGSTLQVLVSFYCLLSLMDFSIKEAVKPARIILSECQKIRLLRQPPQHRHLTRIILKPYCLTGNKAFQNSYNYLGLILFVGEQELRQFPMQHSTPRTS